MKRVPEGKQQVGREAETRGRQPVATAGKGSSEGLAPVARRLLALQRAAGNQAVVQHLLQRRFRPPEGGQRHHNSSGRGGTAEQLIYGATRVHRTSIPWFDIMDRHISVFPDRDGTAGDFHVTFELLPNSGSAGRAHKARSDYEEAMEKEKAKEKTGSATSWRGGPRRPSAEGAVSVHFFYDEKGFLRSDFNQKLDKKLSKRHGDEAYDILRGWANEIADDFIQGLEMVGAGKVAVGSK